MATSKYAKTDFSKDAQKKASTRDGGGSNFSLKESMEKFKPKKGTSNIDIIPFIVTTTTNKDAKRGELYYVKEYSQHVIKLGGETIYAPCPKIMKGLPCVICDEREKLLESDDPDLIKIGEAMRAKKRLAYNVIDLNDADKGVQLWDVSDYVFGDPLAEEINAKPACSGYANLVGGYSLEIRFKQENKGGFNFLDVSRIDLTERDEDYGDNILKDSIDLDKCLIFPDQKVISNLLGASANGEETEPEETETLVGQTCVCIEDGAACTVTVHDGGDNVTIEDSDGNAFEMTVNDITVDAAEPEVAESIVEEPVAEKTDIVEGANVLYCDEVTPCTVSSITGDLVIIIEEDGTEFECTMADLSLVPGEEPEPEAPAEEESLVGKTVTCIEDGVECTVTEHNTETGAVAIKDSDDNIFEMTVSEIEVPADEAPEPEANESLVGKTVKCLEDGVICTVTTHDTETNAVTIEDESGNAFEMTTEDIEVMKGRKVTPASADKPKTACSFGHTYGKDADNTDDCEKCPQEVWDACYEAKGA